MNQLLVIILDLLNHVTDVNPVEALHKKVLALNPLAKGPFAIPYFRVKGQTTECRYNEPQHNEVLHKERYYLPQ